MQQEEETSGFGAVSAGSPVTQVAGIGQNLPLLEAYPAFRLLTTSRGVTNPGFCAKIGVEDKEGRGLLRGVSPRGTLKRGVKRLSRIRETRTRLHVHARTHTHTRARASRHRYEGGGEGQKKPRSGGCSFSRGSNTKDLSAGQPNSLGIWPLKRSVIQRRGIFGGREF